jgi:zinc transporter ZupT
MMNVKKLLAGFFLAIMLFFGMNALVYAQTPKDSVCQGIGLASGGNGCAQPNGQPDVQGTVEKVITILLMLVAVIAILMIIVGGLKYITSGGDSGKVSSAKDTIFYSVIGLVIALLAQVIVRFVVNRLT